MKYKFIEGSYIYTSESSKCKDAANLRDWRESSLIETIQYRVGQRVETNQKIPREKKKMKINKCSAPLTDGGFHQKETGKTFGNIIHPSNSAGATSRFSFFFFQCVKVVVVVLLLMCLLNILTDFERERDALQFVAERSRSRCLAGDALPRKQERKKTNLLSLSLSLSIRYSYSFPSSSTWRGSKSRRRRLKRGKQ